MRLSRIDMDRDRVDRDVPSLSGRGRRMSPDPSQEGTRMTVRYNAVRCMLFVAFLAMFSALALLQL